MTKYLLMLRFACGILYALLLTLFFNVMFDGCWTLANYIVCIYVYYFFVLSVYFWLLVDIIV